MNGLRLNSLKSFKYPRLLSKSYSTSEAVAEIAEETDYVPEIPEKTVNRNKSGLLDAHRNILHGQQPYKEPHSWIHQTEKYQRKIFGRYGSKSNVDPRICFPQKATADLNAKRFKIMEPKSIQVVLQEVHEQEKEKKLKVLKREEEIMKNIEKLEMWKQDLHNKIKKKEADALAAKEKKERLIEEVRRHFGYKVDPRDERFQEMLEQKNREQRKKEKEAKRAAREMKTLTKMMEKNKIESTESKKKEEVVGE